MTPDADVERLRRRLGGGLAGAATLLLVALAVLGVTGGAAADRDADAAPAFDLALIDGGRVTNETLVGRATVLNVWASWCPPCREEAPVLRRAYEDADPGRVAFLGVVRDDTAEAARDFAEAHGLDYPHALDDDVFARALGVRALPSTYVLDARGRIVASHVGPISETRLAVLIEEALVSGDTDDAP